MKVRELGQKIGEIDIGILASILYRLLYFGLFMAILIGIAVKGYQFIDTEPYNTFARRGALHGMADLGLVLAVLIAADFLFKWIVKTYRTKAGRLQ